ncbi:uncharacterized protein BDW47DRAFT_106542 [Aspergillus candidus]|uniref:Uncharacterized protein n=1 Tax=Aspergillus candidus TaxID=41067 RepID=A0A2I2FAH5_ASPCN|nr:hypothetical protein BDW47DRAFT_106542 [Aspergillus candidus]PLB37625.1 hypothetical protein BDW47DRAFT_106542 [Aspergillus candidus]
MGGNTPGVFLTNWKYARHVDPSVTSYRGETTLRQKIDQHPERQQVEAEMEYCMAHDVCSLGVCMIEIITWESLLLAAEHPTVSKSFIAALKFLSL